MGAQVSLSFLVTRHGYTNFIVANMPKRSSVVTACAAAGVVLFSQQAFVPAPQVNRRAQISAVAAGVAALGAAPAFADEIGDAAKKLVEASYPFAKGVDWNNGIYLQAPGAFKPLEAIKAIDKMIVMGAQADPKLLKAAADAHHKAIGSISGAGKVTSRADWDAVNAALGRVIASVPESTVMDVYNSVSSITDPGVPGYLKSLVNGADAEKAYAAFLQFKDVVKNSQVSSPGPAATAQSGGAIGTAAKKLSDASYPFLKSIDWNSDLYIKPLPGVTPQKALLAVDKTIGAEQAVLWSKPTRGQRGRQGLLRVQGRCEGRTALSKDGGHRARFFCFLEPVGSY